MSLEDFRMYTHYGYVRYTDSLIDYAACLLLCRQPCQACLLQDVQQFLLLIDNTITVCLLPY